MNNNSVTTEVQTLRLTVIRLAKHSVSLLNDKGDPKTSLQNCPIRTECLSLITESDFRILHEIQGHETIKANESAASLSLEKSIQLYQGLLEVLIVHFGIFPKQKISLHTIIKWWKLAIQDRLESYYKFQSCYLFSLVTGQNILIDELPNLPTWIDDTPGYLIGGEFYRFSRRVIRDGPTKSQIGAYYAITYVKRAGLAISDEKQTDSVAEHVRNMSGAEYKPRETYKISKRSIHPVRMKDVECGDVLGDILERMEYLLSHDFKDKICPESWRVPSVNACFESTRDNGGSHPLFISDDHADRMANPPHFIGFVKYKEKIEHVYVPYLPSVLYNNLKADLIEEIPLPNATVHKVIEPFKARIITAGPGKLYQAGRCIQKPIHSIMRNNKMFALTGESVTNDLIQSRYQGLKLEPCVDLISNRTSMEFILAGDYSAATDGMHPSVPLAFCRILYIYGYLNRYQYDICKACITGHKLHYPCLSWDDVISRNLSKYVLNPLDNGTRTCPQIMQTWGQLMGSPISFLILCYVNAAIGWVSADYYFGRKLRFAQWQEIFRPLFNGDDSSMASNRLHYIIWRNVASCAGLNSTLGKSYCSPDFAMINSEIFYLVRENGIIIRTEDIFVLNPGLIKGQAKVLVDTRKLCDSDVAVEELLPLCDQLEKAVKKANLLERILCKRLFLGHVWSRLTSTHRPWAVPRCLGGLGLRDIGQPNYGQRMTTAWLLLQAEAKNELRLPKTSVHWHSLHIRKYMARLEESLGCQYINFELISQDESMVRDYLTLRAEENLYGRDIPEFTLDDCFLGEGVKLFRNKYGDGYSKLMISTLSRASYVSPVGDDCLSRLFDSKYLARRLDSKLVFF